MISFSKISKETFENMAKAEFVVDRIYFVEGLGTFITDSTSTTGYKKYDYDFTSDINSAVSGKADKAPGTSGTIFTNSGTDGNLVSSLYSVGVTSATGFGADNKLATEKGAKAYVDQVSAAIDPKYIPKVNPATEGDLPTLTSTGILTDSNVKIGATDKTGFGVSGEVARESAVKEYVDNAIQGVTSDAITGISYSNESAKLSAIIGGVDTEITPGISGLVRGFEYTAPGVITLTTTNANGSTSDYPINIPAEQFLAGVAYTTIPSGGVPAGGLSGVIFTEHGGEEVIPASQLTEAATLSGQNGMIFKFATEGASENEYEYTFIPINDLVKDYNTTEFKDENGKLTLNVVPSGKVNAPWDSFAPSSWVDTNYISKFASGSANANYVPLTDGSGELQKSDYKIGTDDASGNNPTFGGTGLLATEEAIVDLLSFK